MSLKIMERTPRHVDTRSVWQVFSSAPHRMMFCAAAVQLVAVMVLWLAVLLARVSVGWTPTLSVAHTWVHAFLFL